MECNRYLLLSGRCLGHGVSPVGRTMRVVDGCVGLLIHRTRNLSRTMRSLPFFYELLPVKL